MKEISKDFVNTYKGKEIDNVTDAFMEFALDKGTTEKEIKCVYFDLKEDIELILIELYKGLMPEKVKELGGWAKINIVYQVFEELDCETYEVSKQNLIKALEY